MPHLAVACAALALACGLSPRGAFADWRSLSGLMPAHVGSVDYEISPDSQLVVFVTDADTEGVDELWVVPITGDAAPIKLNPPLVAGGDVGRSRFVFTPDSSRVVYLADQEVDNRVEMYTVPVGGGMAVKLNPPLVVGGNVASFKIDPDSGRVVYVADQETNDVFELWSVSGTGGGLFKLSGPFVSGGDIGIFEIDPLSNRAVYSADQETDGKFELYSAPLTGGGSTKLNPPIALAGGGDSGIFGEFAVNRIVPVVVFIARQAGALNGRVYMTPTAGGMPTLLSFNLLPVQRMLSVRVSPFGDRVVFSVATKDANSSENSFKGNLYSTLIGGGGNADLTAPPADPYYGVSFFFFTPDGQRVVYDFQQNAAATRHLESSGVSTGVRATLFAPSASDPQLGSFVVSPDSQWVAYHDTSGDLYTVPSGGGSAVRHAASGPGGGVILPDSSRVVFRRTTGPEQQTDLFSAQIFGGDQRDLSGLEGTGYVNDVTPATDSQSIVFVVQIDGQYDLRVSDGAEAQSPTTTTISILATTTTTTPGASSTSTTLPPGVREICGNCVDDDGDGRVDLDDDACCGAAAALTLTRGKMSATRGGGTRLAVKATLDDASVVPAARPLPDVRIQLGPAGGAPLLCALVPSGSLKLRKATLEFRDKRGLVTSAQGLDRLTLGRRKSGRGSLALRGRETPFSLPEAGPLRLTIGASVGGQASSCRTVTSDYRSTRKGLRTQ